MNAEDRYDSLFQYYAEKKDFNWRLLKAQVKAESDFNPSAKSPAGALGLPQFMWATWLEWRDGTPGIQATKMILRRTNPEHAIRAQAAYMKWLYKEIRKIVKSQYLELDLVLIAYNFGIGRVRRLAAKGHLTARYLPTETLNYIKKVKNNLTALIKNSKTKERIR